MTLNYTKPLPPALRLSLNEQYDLGYAAEPRQSRKIARAGRWDERWGKYHASLAKFCALRHSTKCVLPSKS